MLCFVGGDLRQSPCTCVRMRMRMQSVAPQCKSGWPAASATERIMPCAAVWRGCDMQESGAGAGAGA